MVDFLIVGAGLYGSVCARVLADRGYKVRVIESREHIGGNCYTFKEGDIDVHKYGAHIFHTSDEEVWEFVNNYISFYTYFHRPVVNYKSKMAPKPHPTCTQVPMHDQPYNAACRLNKPPAPIPMHLA